MCDHSRKYSTFPSRLVATQNVMLHCFVQLIAISSYHHLVSPCLSPVKFSTAQGLYYHVFFLSSTSQSPTHHSSVDLPPGLSQDLGLRHHLLFRPPASLHLVMFLQLLVNIIILCKISVSSGQYMDMYMRDTLTSKRSI